LTGRVSIALDADAIVRAGSSLPDAPLVVFLHGFGGNEHDWTPYFDLIPSSFAAAALRGPVALGDRWAWVHFGDGQGGLGAFSAAARGVHAWLDTLGARRVVLVGWSQGAAMAIHLARQRPDRFDAVVMGAGFVWELRPHAALRARRLPVWYGIGTDDEVIPPRMVRSARRWLAETTELTEVEYPGARHLLTPALAHDAIAYALSRFEALPAR
jgi:phospholipase/carboxylesterase